MACAVSPECDVADETPPFPQAMGDWRRIGLCLVLALSLHASLVWVATRPSPDGLSPTLPSSAAAAVALLPVDVVAPEPPLGDTPGGGSEAPVPEASPEARPESPGEKQPLPQLPRAPKNEVLPHVSEQLAEAPTSFDDPTQQPDVLTQASSHGALAESVRFGPDTRRPTATASRVAPQVSALSAYRGSGPGRSGGPGGRGAGNGGGGVVRSSFAFGGPSGAFRADVCFIPVGTPGLRAIRRCPPEVTFFTDHLDVPPRSFTQGFPGVTERTEWFAVYYSGMFHVAKGDYFTFRLISDDGSLLYIDDYLIIDHDHQHAPIARDATIPLAAGKHAMRLEYYQGPRDRIALQLFVTGSDGQRRLFGPVI